MLLAELPLIVLLVSVARPLLLMTRPPPPSLAVLPASVLPYILSVPLLSMPPPPELVVLLKILLFSIIALPKFRMPPPPLLTCIADNATICYCQCSACASLDATTSQLRTAVV